YFQPALDTYLNVDWDEHHIGKTQVSPKTNEPCWNEEFIANNVRSGRAVGFTVFHNYETLPDEFLARIKIPFSNFNVGSTNDIWLHLEPHGQLHVAVELHGSTDE
ncbi:hypothetical protein Angca_006712, partial [Angiostrongylus cantonensis]